MTVLLKSSSSQTFAISTFSGIYLLPSYIPLQKKKIGKEILPCRSFSLCLRWWRREIDECCSANFLAFLSREACTWLGTARNMISTGPQAAAKFHSRGWIHGHFWDYRTAHNTGLSLQGWTTLWRLSAVAILTRNEWFVYVTGALC